MVIKVVRFAMLKYMVCNNFNKIWFDTIRNRHEIYSQYIRQCGFYVNINLLDIGLRAGYIRIN